MQNLWCCRCRRVVDLKLPIQIHLPRGLKFAIGSMDFVDIEVTAMNIISTHVIKQI